MRSIAPRLLGVIAVGAVVASCGEQPTSPPVVSGSAAHRTLLGSPATVQVVTRNTPLPSPLTASAVIGAFGGTVSLPAAGLTVMIPPFAVTSPTTITVTAVAGSEVAYEFSPHGKQFLVPLLVTQDLSGTSASGVAPLHPFVAGYFANVSDLDQVNATALVSELLSTSLNLLTHKLTFPVFHFSGYLVASGNESTDDDTSR